jgi:hypothetical protein
MPTTYCPWTDDEDEEFDSDYDTRTVYLGSYVIQPNKLDEKARIEARLVAIADKKKPPNNKKSIK